MLILIFVFRITSPMLYSHQALIGSSNSALTKGLSVPVQSFQFVLCEQFPTNFFDLSFHQLNSSTLLLTLSLASVLQLVIPFLSSSTRNHFPFTFLDHLIELLKQLQSVLRSLLDIGLSSSIRPLIAD